MAVFTCLATDMGGGIVTDSSLMPVLLNSLSGVGRQEQLHLVAGEEPAMD